MKQSKTISETVEAENELFKSVPKNEIISRAGFCVSNQIIKIIKKRNKKLRESNVLLLVGKGNNGADALLAGKWLLNRSVRVQALICDLEFNQSAFNEFYNAGGKIFSFDHNQSNNSEVLENSGTNSLSGVHIDCLSQDSIIDLAKQSDIIVDGIFGIGLKGRIHSKLAWIPNSLNVELKLSGALSEKYKPYLSNKVGDFYLSRPAVVAIDVPSGINADSGQVDGAVLHADVTVSFDFYKPAHLLFPSNVYCGRVIICSIGLKDSKNSQQVKQQKINSKQKSFPKVLTIEPKDFYANWTTPNINSHKYSRGVLGIVAGSTIYPGAAVMCTRAAVKAGAAFVRYLGPKKAIQRVISATPEIIPNGGIVNAWAMGPGVAIEDEAQVARLKKVLSWALEAKTPAVLDAGALKLLNNEPLAPWVVLTPHAGEAERILVNRGVVGVKRSHIEQNPEYYAKKLHELTGATIVLKGWTTIIASDIDFVYAQTGATPWLATAGAGDVLTGIIGAFMSVVKDSKLSYDVAKLCAYAVVAHSLAANKAADAKYLKRYGGHPISALDIVECLPKVLNDIS